MNIEEYVNVPPIIGAVISSRMATIVELQTVLSVDDVHDLIEVISIDAYNRQLVKESQKD